MSSEAECGGEQELNEGNESPQGDAETDIGSDAEFRGFALVEIIEIIHIVIFIVGGSFAAAAALMSLIGIKPEMVAVQASIGGVGGFLLGIVLLIEFILQRYG